MAVKGWCRHYTGVGNGDTCKEGVEYESIKDTSAVPYRWHCFSPDSAIKCPHYEAYTDEEVAESERKVDEWVAAHNALMERKSDTCPHCGEQVMRIQQVSRSMYARPCGCRLGLGRVPDMWKG